MSEETHQSASALSPLPDAPNLEWLRKQAKHRLAELRKTSRDAKLSDAQFALAKQYGFPSWRALKSHVDSLTIDGQLFDAARKGDVDKLKSLLDAHPDKLYARNRPYEHTLLHLAAQNGHLAAVDFLLKLGIDPNTREKGDNTYAMHWAAAAGHLDVVRRLADAGGDVVGEGDDHALGMIGWATGWDGCDDATHRGIANFLISRGARHNIYSAMAINDDNEVRRIVAADPRELERTQSHNEDFRRPLHFAVHKQLHRTVSLLLELGSDPLGTDASGNTAVAYAMSTEIARPVLEAIRARVGPTLLTSVALGDWDNAARLVREDPRAVERDGILHLMSKSNNVAAVKWLLDHGANPDARWDHWGAVVTPLHLAALAGHPDIARVLLDAGADPTIHDTQHDSDALGWAEFFRRSAMVEMINARRERREN
ncbi:MAG TPA: ankyrin repeat domain-containing protein [Gemmatimonadaceae bacterium]|nr:ankyrin repeat domain-containing protein [Gemmatimonadaceae bacterium]